MSRELRDLETKARGGMLKSSRRMHGKVRGKLSALFNSNPWSQMANRGYIKRVSRAANYLESRTGRHTFGGFGADAPSRVTPGGAARSSNRGAYR